MTTWSGVHVEINNMSRWDRKRAEPREKAVGNFPNGEVYHIGEIWWTRSRDGQNMCERTTEICLIVMEDLKQGNLEMGNVHTRL